MCPSLILGRAFPDDIFEFFHGFSAEFVNLDVLLVDVGVCIPRPVGTISTCVTSR
jgi:hypothetical protein